MKNEKRKYEHKASTRDYLIALSYFPNFVKLLNSKDKPYEKLTDWLIEKESFLTDESRELPTIKELSNQVNIDKTIITKYLKQLYFEIFELNFNEPHLFKKEGQILCNLSFKFLGNYKSFNIGLDTIPRVGEHFDFFFMRAMLGCSSYSVSKIYHDLYHTGQSIMISLIWQHPNSYLNLLKEKAYLNREISFKEYLDDEIETELEDRLVKRSRGL